MAKYPTEEECEKLLDDYRIPVNIRRHIGQVTRIAVFIAGRLEQAGIGIDVGLVRAGASLHDIARTVDIRDLSQLPDASEEDMEFYKSLKKRFSMMKHNEAGYELFREKYPELAKIIRSHVYSSVIDDKAAPSTWEEKVVYYADKRVAHDRLVSIAERNEEGMQRWKKSHPGEQADAARTEKINAKIRRIEDEIFSAIGSSPDELQKEMENEERRG